MAKKFGQERLERLSRGWVVGLAHFCIDHISHNKDRSGSAVE